MGRLVRTGQAAPFLALLSIAKAPGADGRMRAKNCHFIVIPAKAGIQ